MGKAIQCLMKSLPPFVLRWAGFIVTMGLVASLAFPPAAIGQLSLPDSLISPTPQSGVVSESEFSSAEVFFNGRVLFYVTAATVASEEGGLYAVSPAILRAQRIAERLSDPDLEGISPNRLMVEFIQDELGQSPLILINDTYLMTVTPFDAQLGGVDVETRAQGLVEIVRDALIESYHEHRPKYLFRQGVKAALILAIVAIASYWISRRQGRLVKHLDTLIDTQADEEAPISENISAEQVSESTPGRQPFRFRQFQWNSIAGDKIQLRSLGLLKISLWLIGLLISFGLFPHTRGIQTFLVRAIQGPIFKILVVIFVSYFLIQASRIFVQNLIASLRKGGFITKAEFDRRNQRLITFSNVLKGTTTFTIVILAMFSVVAILGVNIAPILAGAGILGLGISFGAQSLVKDIINGIFILIEDQFGVGDVIDVGGFSGFVEQLNLRTTQLRSADGELITIPNSAITVVQNSTSSWSRVNIGVGVAYGTDIDRAIAIISEVANEMSLELPWKLLILEPPIVLGVDDFGADGITIRVWIKTQPLKQWMVGREYRRRLKITFDREDIQVPFPQRSVWIRDSLRSDRDATSRGISTDEPGNNG